MREKDRCVQIPVRVAGIVLLGATAIALAGWQTFFDGPGVAGEVWSILAVVWAATLTVVHCLTRHHRALRRAFELGREMERAHLTALR